MDILERLLELGPNQPWWIWFLAVVIPLCILLSFREFMCWFWKINALLRRLERLDRRLAALQMLAEGSTPIKENGKARELKSDEEDFNL